MSSTSSPEIVLTSSPDGPILAYEASTGDSVARFTASRSPRRGLTLVGKGFIAASHVSAETAAGSIHFYNWCSSAVFHSFPVPEPIASLAATPDGTFLFAGGIAGSIFSLSLPSGKIIKCFPAHKRSITSLRLSDDGSLVISGGDDGNIVVIPTFRLLEALEDHEDPQDLILYRLKAHSDSVTAIHTGIGLYNATLISCSLDCTCKFWSLGNGALLGSVSFPCGIFEVAIDKSESELYAAGSDGLVYNGSMKDVGNGKSLKTADKVVSWSQSHNGPIVSLVLVNEGRNLLSASEDGSVWVWEVEKGEVLKVLGGGVGRLSDMIVASGSLFGVGGSKNAGEGITIASGLRDDEMLRSIKQIMEVGEAMSGVIDDRKKAMEMLGTAIASYERLLELIVKEAANDTGGATEEKKEEEDKGEKGDKESASMHD